MSSSKIVQNLFKGVFFGAGGIVIASHMYCLYDIHCGPPVTVEKYDFEKKEFVPLIQDN